MAVTGAAQELVSLGRTAVVAAAAASVALVPLAATRAVVATSVALQEAVRDGTIDLVATDEAGNSSGFELLTYQTRLR